MSAENRNTSAVFSGFDASSRWYDQLVALNPGYHRHLARSASQLTFRDRGRGARLLDVGCGTGASTAALLTHAPEAEIVAADASSAMLAQARRKPELQSVRFVHARLDELGHAGIQGPFDGAFAAYLIRNLSDVDSGLRTLFALLRPGSPLSVHEYSLRSRGLTRLVWNSVCWCAIIPAGWALTGSTGLYRYLWRSVRDFDTPTDFAHRLETAGFHQVRRTGMPGWQRGIAHTFFGIRPGEHV